MKDDGGKIMSEMRRLENGREIVVLDEKLENSKRMLLLKKALKEEKNYLKLKEKWKKAEAFQDECMHAVREYVDAYMYTDERCIICGAHIDSH